MSINAVERLLFEVAASPDLVRQFKDTPEQLLGAYALAPDEAELVRHLDVHEIASRGVNPMLVMRAFAAIEGRERMPEYFRRMGGN